MKILPWKKCSMSQRSWWIIRKKLIAWTKFCKGRILGHICHWLMTKYSSICKAQKSLSSQILCCVSERFFNLPNPTKLGKTELQEPEPRVATKIMMLSTESLLNSSGTFSKDSQRWSSVKNQWSSELYRTHQKLSQEELYFMSMFNDISGDKNDNKDECLKNANYVKTFAGRFGIGQWSSRFWEKVVFFRE